jgi:hypothetical protein
MQRDKTLMKRKRGKEEKSREFAARGFKVYAKE